MWFYSRLFRFFLNIPVNFCSYVLFTLFSKKRLIKYMCCKNAVLLAFNISWSWNQLFLEALSFNNYIWWYFEKRKAAKILHMTICCHGRFRKQLYPDCCIILPPLIWAPENETGSRSFLRPPVTKHRKLILHA